MKPPFDSIQALPWKHHFDDQLGISYVEDSDGVLVAGSKLMRNMREVSYREAKQTHAWITHTANYFEKLRRRNRRMRRCLEDIAEDMCDNDGQGCLCVEEAQRTLKRLKRK